MGPATVVAATSCRYEADGSAAAHPGQGIVSRSRRRRRSDELVLAGALNQERTRLARELHDGLAQDLAFIAASAQGLEPELGVRHPLVIAARRALDASRGLMADLAARSAPTTAAALALVGDELGERFGVRVEVSATALTGRSDLGPTEREEIVMIAREAIVNAIKHGHARRIDVILDLDGKRPLLLVRDDGGGVTSSTPGSVSGCRRCGLVLSRWEDDWFCAVAPAAAPSSRCASRRRHRRGGRPYRRLADDDRRIGGARPEHGVVIGAHQFVDRGAQRPLIVHSAARAQQRPRHRPNTFILEPLAVERKLGARVGSAASTRTP